MPDGALLIGPTRSMVAVLVPDGAALIRPTESPALMPDGASLIGPTGSVHTVAGRAL